MEEEKEVEQFGDVRYGNSRNTKNVTTALYEGDFNLLEYIQRYLGCSRSEATRSAIRAFASQISAIDKR